MWVRTSVVDTVCGASNVALLSKWSEMVFVARSRASVNSLRFSHLPVATNACVNQSIIFLNG